MRVVGDPFANPRVLPRALQQQGLSLTLNQRTQGESDIAVAAAPILAREWIILGTGPPGQSPDGFPAAKKLTRRRTFSRDKSLPISL